ncbi:hypothetical protein Tco_0983268 [Tanacetum coccineum]
MIRQTRDETEDGLPTRGTRALWKQRVVASTQQRKNAKSQRSTNSFASSSSNPTMFQDMLQQQYELNCKEKIERFDREKAMRVELINSQKNLYHVDGGELM